MSEFTALSQNFTVVGPAEVRFTRSLASTREIAWPMLAKGKKLAKWFLPVTVLEPRSGGRYTIHTENGGLDGTLTAFDPLHSIAFDDKMRFELFDGPTPETCTLTLTLARDANGWVPSNLAGFQTMLDNLQRLLAGLPVFERAAYMQAWRLHCPLCEQAISTALAGGAKVVYRVHFPLDEDRPSGDTAGQIELQQFLQQLTHQPTLHVAIDGFADEPLDRAKAFRLSQRRAECMKAYLIQNGIAAQRITTRAFGNYYRLHPSRDENATRLNRRVELILLF